MQVGACICVNVDVGVGVGVCVRACGQQDGNVIWCHDVMTSICVCACVCGLVTRKGRSDRYKNLVTRITQVSADGN